VVEQIPLAYRGERDYFGSVTERNRVSKPSDLLQGTLDLLLLKILALEPLNGWSISQRLRQVSGDVLQVSDGSLYPALHKLEQEGWITAEWRPSENNRRAKFYSLTRPGRKQLEKEAASWERLSGAITQVVKLSEA
jgi:PadR family transcriptional regulator, regulatory protein PadR